MQDTIFNDAYCHVGMPRFGAPEEALEVFDRWNIHKGVFVLGPQVPDYAALFAAIRSYPDRIRGIGLPFGSTAAKRREMTEIQIRAGVSGLRMDPTESLENPEILTVLGEHGLWVYAVSLPHQPDLARIYLDWLERYPESKIAAPHFLDVHPCNLAGDEGVFRELLTHHRFYAIFSRHGHMGSRESYPHPDFLPWVEQVGAYYTWDRILWGSEFPVHYWRNEQTNSCQDWIEAVGISLTGQEKRKFWYENTERLFFTSNPPAVEPITIPAGVEEEVQRNRTVPLFPFTTLDVPMDVYAGLRKDLRFAEYIIEKLQGETSCINA